MPADLSYASCFVSEDTKPMGVDMRGNPFIEERTWQAYMYKRQVKKMLGEYSRSLTQKEVFPPKSTARKKYLIK